MVDAAPAKEFTTEEVAKVRQATARRSQPTHPAGPSRADHPTSRLSRPSEPVALLCCRSCWLLCRRLSPVAQQGGRHLGHYRLGRLRPLQVCQVPPGRPRRPDRRHGRWPGRDGRLLRPPSGRGAREAGLREAPNRHHQGPEPVDLPAREGRAQGGALRRAGWCPVVPCFLTCSEADLFRADPPPARRPGSPRPTTRPTSPTRTASSR